MERACASLRCGSSAAGPASSSRSPGPFWTSVGLSSRPIFPTLPRPVLARARPRRGDSSERHSSSSRRDANQSSSARRSRDAGPTSLELFESRWLDPTPPPRPTSPSVFPRQREPDPRKLLGIAPDAAYEEARSAYSYLLELYRDHDPSREAIEAAMEALLLESLHHRQRYGFQPSHAGLGGGFAGLNAREGPGTKGRRPVQLTFLERLLDAFEPVLPRATLVNEGLVVTALAALAAWQQAANHDATIMMGLALGYALWRVSRKRLCRDPEAEFWGGSPVWGAAGSVAATLAASAMVCTIGLQFVSMRGSKIPLGLFLTLELVGLGSIVFK